jgi:hypothetical protein
MLDPSLTEIEKLKAEKRSSAGKSRRLSRQGSHERNRDRNRKKDEIQFQSRKRNRG